MALLRGRYVYHSIVGLIGLVGVLAGVIATLQDQDLLGGLLLAIGSSVLASLLFLVLGDLVPAQPPPFKLIRGHEEIYAEFRRMLAELDDGRPHVVRTINSFTPDPRVRGTWDSRVAEFLSQNKDATFIRVIFARDDQDWRERLRQFEERLHGLDNYHEHLKLDVPGSVELFLVDTSAVMLSIATPQVDGPPVTYAIKITDRETCGALEAYHRNNLQSRIPRRRVLKPAAPASPPDPLRAADEATS